MLPLSLWVGLAGLVLGALGGWSWSAGHGRAEVAALQRDFAAERARAAAGALAVERKLAADYAAASSRAAAVELGAARRAEAQRRRDAAIGREVVRYATLVPVGRRCRLDPLWRLHHDAAASGDDGGLSGAAAAGGAAADASGQIDGLAAGPVDDAAALATVAGNYAECRHWREQLMGWQAWWEAVAPAGGSGLASAGKATEAAGGG